MLIFQGALMLLTVLLGVPVLWFAAQVFYGCRRSDPAQGVTPRNRPTRVAILVPAHNESVHLLPTLHALLADAQANTRVVVVADNCTDDTAAVARAAGAEVIERDDPGKRGKGYALDFGIQHLASCPPEVVIVMDADCLPEQGALGWLAEMAQGRQKPVQALYVMNNPGRAGLRVKIAQFAWCVKNLVRPRGLHQLGLPCQLTGSGMAFPWHTLQAVSLANGHLVEDMQLGMSLIAMGHGPVFMEHAVVSSQFPSQETGLQSQRTRWEHGHLSMMMSEGFPQIWQALRHRNSTLFWMALDVCVPPLALLVLSLLLWTGFVTTVGVLTAQWWPWAMSMGLLCVLGFAVVVAWMKFGRGMVSAIELLYAPLYALCKLPVYVGFVVRKQSAWVRSKRDGENS
ncbi:MAG TPA: glycosyltransferase family 2 protein [Limnobacter sp.]|nr:glycosyltransferase family 2 protein [Limnobacter sp.]